MANGKDGKTFTCGHGKGKVSSNGTCSCRAKNGMCSKGGHPCKRIGK